MIIGEDVCRVLPEENPSDEEKRLYKTWIKKSQKVLHWILICISKTLISHIKKTDTERSMRYNT